MRQKIVSLLVVGAMFLPQVYFVFAQTLDTAPTEPAMDTAPAEEMVAPTSDTTPPNFISIATASAEENEANIVWTTDELAYGYVQYGETAGYGQTTPKSTMATMDGNASLTNLKSGTVYHYRVVAEDEAGNIAYSEDRTLETAVEVVAMDSVPPEISQINVSNITTSGANISWTTDELAQGKVEYGKTVSYGSATPPATDYALEHSITLAALQAGTQYHFRVVVQDESGNSSVSPDEIFTTSTAAPAENNNPPPAEETATTTPETPTSTTTPETTEPAPETTTPSTPFTISQVETSAIGTSTASIVWSTNEPATAQVFYGQGENYASSTPVAGTYKTSQEIKLVGLKSGTNYFYKVVSTNSAGQTIEKNNFEFNTLYPKKQAIKAPVIFNLSVPSVGTSTAIITWNTDVPTTGEVKYGLTTAYRQSDGGHIQLLTAHTHPLFGLASNTTYNFVAIVRDANGNETIYENQTFRTTKDPSTINTESGLNNQNINESENPVTDETTEAPVQNAGGGHHSYTHTLTLAAPKLIKVQALDGQTMFVWTAQKARRVVPGATQVRLNTVIVRNTTNYPEKPTFGKIVYQGNSGLFTDTRLENGQTYYYSVFTVNQFNSYSQPTRFKITPTEAEKEVALEAVPTVVQKNPIYVFPKPLKLGDKNKQVEHLQILLASEESIYAAGLITGYFGQLTEKAVQTFQQRHKIPATGTADRATLKKLEQLSSIEVVQDKSSVFETALFRDLKIGSVGGDVSILQQFLSNYGVYPEALVTGYFGALTQSALAAFQKSQNISPALGYFGPATKKRMTNLIRLRSISF